MLFRRKSHRPFRAFSAISDGKALVAIAIILMVVKMVATAQQHAGMPGASTNLEQQGGESLDEILAKKRIREGTIIEGAQGYFRVTGSRVTLFTSDESRRFVCLENLNLERVLQVIRDNPTQLEWSVDGELTEYQGENFLLIHRVLLSAPSEDSYR